MAQASTVFEGAVDECVIAADRVVVTGRTELGDDAAVVATVPAIYAQALDILNERGPF
jgi:hypothetical protein